MAAPPKVNGSPLVLSRPEVAALGRLFSDDELTLLDLPELQSISDADLAEARRTLTERGVLENGRGHKPAAPFQRLLERVFAPTAAAVMEIEIDDVTTSQAVFVGSEDIAIETMLDDGVAIYLAPVSALPEILIAPLRDTFPPGSREVFTTTRRTVLDLLDQQKRGLLADKVDGVPQFASEFVRALLDWRASEKIDVTIVDSDNSALSGGRLIVIDCGHSGLWGFEPASGSEWLVVGMLTRAWLEDWLASILTLSSGTDGGEPLP